MSDGGAQPEERRLVCATFHYSCVLNIYKTVNNSVFHCYIKKEHDNKHYDNMSDWKLEL